MDRDVNAGILGRKSQPIVLILPLNALLVLGKPTGEDIIYDGFNKRPNRPNNGSWYDMERESHNMLGKERGLMDLWHDKEC